MSLGGWERRPVPGPGTLTALLSVVAVAGPLFLLTTMVGNRLVRHPEWVASKTRLGLDVMGADAFVSESQALARGRLDLSAWHGYQEVMLRDSSELSALSFRFRLAENAYVTIRWENDELGGRALRLSRHPAFPGALLSVASDGAFSSRELITLPELDGGWYRVRLAFDDGLTGHLDGTRFLHLEGEPGRASRPGFRGGQHPAYIDDVEVVTIGGSRMRERFRMPDDWLGRLLLSMAGAGVLVLAMRRAVRRAAKDAGGRVADAALLTLSALFGLLIAVVHVAYTYRFAERYPPEASRTGDESAFVQERVAARDEVLVGRSPTPPTPDVIRVMVLGTSQTHGSGAGRAEETFVARLEAALNSGRAAGARVCRYEVINAGVRAAGSSELAAVYARWLETLPQLVIVHLSHNDGAPNAFRENLRRIRDLNDARGIVTLFSLEPNSIENRPGELPMHPVMRAVAEESDAAIVDVHEALKPYSDSGFLWWDRVHPTSYGHALIASLLAPAVTALGLECPAAANAS